MRQNKQAFLHKPEEGIWGDCFRTAVSCVLECDRDEVPHVFHDGARGQIADARMNDWLKTRGLRQFVIPFEGSVGVQGTLDIVGQFSAETEYLLYGTSKNGTDHVVCCRGSKIVWDPAIDSSGIVGPCADGFVWVVALAATRPVE